MPTDADQFEIIRRWQRCDAEHQRTTSAANSATKTGPLRALYATRELIESLNAGRWHMITAARIGGAAWDEIARAMGDERGGDALRSEYSELVEWYSVHPSIAVDIKRWIAAI